MNNYFTTEQALTLSPRAYAYAMHNDNSGFFFEDRTLADEVKSALERRATILKTWHLSSPEQITNYNLYRAFGLSPKEAYKLAYRLGYLVNVHFEDFVAMAKDELGDDFRADDEIYRLRVLTVRHENLYYDKEVSALANCIAFENLFFEVQLQDEVSEECGPVWLEKKSRGW